MPPAAGAYTVRAMRQTVSYRARGRFCSRACYRKFSGETSIETKVRQSLERLCLPFIQELQVGQYVVDFALNGIALEVDGIYWHPQPEIEEKWDARA
jgi:very-short-patch-repair endonuclease